MDTLNCLARCYQRFQNGDMEKFHSIFDVVWPQTPEEAVFLAENLCDFTVIDGISTAEEYGKIIAEERKVGDNLLEFLDFLNLGQHRINEVGGVFGAQGYVAYKGNQPEIKKIMARLAPSGQEPQMGGLT